MILNQEKMKLKNILIAVITLIAILTFSSCEDYLDVKPYGKTIPKTADEFGSLLHNTLNNIDLGGDRYIIGNYYTIANFDAGASDDFEACITLNNSRDLIPYIGSYTNLSASQYSNLYKNIRNCNLVINEMTEKNTKLSDKVFATAYAMRGVCYYNLLKAFCETPKKGKFDSQLGVPVIETFDIEEKAKRSSMQKVINLIKSDFENSLKYNLTDEIYRFTKYVVVGYQARIAFWTEDWTNAIKYSRQLLEEYPLLNIEEYKDMMTTKYALKGNELIKSYRNVSFSNSISMTEKAMQDRPISKRFINNFAETEKEKDIRYALWLNNKRIVTKYPFCGMRSAEFKLIEAESLYHLGQNEDALQSINDLRANRIADYVPLTMASLTTGEDQISDNPAVIFNNPASILPTELIKSDAEGKEITPLLSLILRERRKELFLEGDRFYELKRNNCPEFTTIFSGLKYTTLKYMYTFPLPVHDVVLSDLKQNPGYIDIIN